MNASVKTQKGLWNSQFLSFLIFKIISISSVTTTNSVLSLYIVDRYNGSAAQVGLISSLTVLTTMIFRPFSGFIVDRWGRKRALIISFIFIALSNFLLILPLNMVALGIIRFFVGIPFSLYTTATGTVSADILPDENRSDGFGIISIVTMLAGVVLAPNLGFLLMGNGFYERIFMTTGFLGLAAIILVMLMPYKDVRNPAATFSMNTSFEGKAYRIAAVLCFLMLGMPGLFTFGPLYAQQLGVGSKGLFLLFYGCGLLISRRLCRNLVNMDDPKKVATVTIALILVGFSMIGSIHSTVGFFLGSCILGIGYGMVFAIFSPMALRLVDPCRLGACNATLIFGQDIGSFLGLYVFSWSVQAFENYSTPYLLIGLMMVIPLGIFYKSGLPHYMKMLNEKSQEE